MFHWICPECGREIPPSVRECQACDPRAAQEAAAEIAVVEAAPLAPVAETIATPPPLPHSEPVVAPVAAIETREVETGEVVEIPTSVGEAEAALVTESAPESPAEVAAEPVVEAAPEPVVESIREPVAEVAAAPDVEATPDPVVESIPEPVAEVAATAVVEAIPEPVVEPIPKPVAEVAAAPVVEATPEPVVESIPEPVAEVAAASVVEATPEPVAESIPEPVADLAAAPVIEAEPEPVVEPIPEPVAQVAAAPPVEAAPEPVVESAPVPQPVAEAPPEIPPTHELPDPLLVLAEEIRAAQAERAAALTAPERAGLIGLAEAVGMVVVEEKAPPVPVPVLAARTPAEEAEAAAILKAPPQDVTAQFPIPVALLESLPVAVAPEPEPEGPTLPFAPMQHYSPATKRSIPPVAPRQQILGANSGPRITLPGPTLPPELTRLQDANVVTVVGERTEQRERQAAATPKPGASGMFVSAGVMLLLMAAAWGIVSFWWPHTTADAKPAPTPAAAATTAAPAKALSPLAKFIEVTGFRVVVDGKKSEVQYLVVNHSAADISDANVFVTLRNVKPGQPPLCRFSFKVPSLGPFESKEMSSPIEKITHSVALPEWQDLRAETQISQ